MTYTINKPKTNWCQYTLNDITYDIGPNYDAITKKEILQTEEQCLETAQRIENWKANSANRKLKQIKAIRLSKLKETDFYALGDVTMSDEMKTWRQSLRDIPANHTDEAAYDLLLARETDETKDSFGELTHSIWSKP